MGHRRSGYGYGHGYRGGGHGRGLISALGAMPRGLKIVLALVVLLIALVGVIIAVLVAWVLFKLVAGGSLPSLLQDALDFIQRNLRALLNLLRLLG